MPRYGRVDREYGLRLATYDEDRDGPVYMLNLMKYRDTADYGDGTSEVTGREADDRYAPVDVLEKIGAAVAFTADVVASSEPWDRVAVARYATRRSFIEMQSRDDFKTKHVHKEAGMDHTVVMGTLPNGALPVRTKPDRVLLEVWQGDEPAPVGDGEAWGFAVEGTIIGDGRTWTGARYTRLALDTMIDVTAGTDDHQLLVLRPHIERWT